jgi:hypothetical protein
MTDKLLEGLAAQGANMAKTDMQHRGQINGVLASYFEGRGLRRMRKVEALLEEKIGKDWLNHDAAKHATFGVLCFSVQHIPPDAVVIAFGANMWMSLDPAAKGDKLPGDRLISIAQTRDRVCIREQEIRGRLVIGEPRIMFVDQADWKGRLKIFGEPPPEIAAAGERMMHEMVFGKGKPS